MTGWKPPRFPSWLLRHLYLGLDVEAVLGDLMERYATRRSRWWYWNQVLSTILVGAFFNFSGKGSMLMKRILFVSSIVVGVFLLGVWIGRNPLFQKIEAPVIDREAIFQRAAAQKSVRTDMETLQVEFLKMQLGRAVADSVGQNDPKSRTRIADLTLKLEQVQRRIKENKGR